MRFCKTENAAIDSLFRNNHGTILCVFWNAFGTRSWEHSGTRSECVLERVPERVRNAFGTRFSLGYFPTVLYMDIILDVKNEKIIFSNT